MTVAGLCVVVGVALLGGSLATGAVAPLYGSAAACVAALIAVLGGVVTHRRRDDR